MIKWIILYVESVKHELFHSRHQPFSQVFLKEARLHIVQYLNC